MGICRRRAPQGLGVTIPGVVVSGCRWGVAILGVMLLGATGCGPSDDSRPADNATGRAFAPRLQSVAIGEPLGENKAWITHLTIADLDADGRPDVVACDSRANQIRWIRQGADGSYTEYAIGGEVRAPAHIAPADFDRDGDLDLLAASMGVLMPNNQKIGSVVLLRNDGPGAASSSTSEVEGALAGSPLAFSQHVLLQEVARVTDVRAADFDGDGDLDLAVGQFGYDEGEIRWMENLGAGTATGGTTGDAGATLPEFASHKLLDLSGTINTPVADMDGDGDPDIVAIVSQEWEEVHVFQNQGRGQFVSKVVYGSTNEDFGSSGIRLADLDQDGDLDVLYTNGDSFDFMPPGPRPWHGVQWLENRGGLEFTYHRIGDFPGAYSVREDDVDRDGDLDLFVVSEFNDWSKPQAISFGWFENTGGQQFVLHPLATTPTHLLVLDAADLDGDGDTDFVTGGVYFYAPYDRMARVLLWRNDSDRRPAGS